MRTLVVIFPALFLFFNAVSSEAAVFKTGTHYQVCFTPYQNCTTRIVQLINGAKKSIYMQAYSFTADPIASALGRAHRRGVKVCVIVDKSQFKGPHFSQARYLKRHGIPLWDDNELDIAHNKVIIVDKSIVETGSFNYTVSAQRYNAENVLIIRSKVLAKKYVFNWKHRQRVSVKVKPSS